MNCTIQVPMSIATSVLMYIFYVHTLFNTFCTAGGHNNAPVQSGVGLFIMSCCQQINTNAVIALRVWITPVWLIGLHFILFSFLIQPIQVHFHTSIKLFTRIKKIVDNEMIKTQRKKKGGKKCRKTYTYFFISFFSLFLIKRQMRSSTQHRPTIILGVRVHVLCISTIRNIYALI